MRTDEANRPRPIYRKRAFDADIIEPCVRWYITYRLSYRDLVEMMAEHGIEIAQTTILKWITRYFPEPEKRWSRFSRAVGFCSIDSPKGKYRMFASYHVCQFSHFITSRIAPYLAC